MADLYRLWARPGARHAWRPVGAPAPYGECVARIGDPCCGIRHGEWYVRPVGKPPDGKVSEGRDLLAEVCDAVEV